MVLIQSLRYLIAALLAIALSMCVHYTQIYWLVIVGLLLVHFNRLTLGLSQVLHFGISGCILALLIFSGALWSTLPLFWLSFGILTFFAVYLGMYFEHLWCSNFLTVLLCMASFAFGTHFSVAAPRFFWSLCGIGLALVMNMSFYLLGQKATKKQLVKQCLEDLGKLSRGIFGCYVNKDYQEKFYIYEKFLHDKRSAFLSHLHHYHLLANKKSQHIHAIFLKLEQAYAVILSLHLLLLRVEDQTTFEVAYKEFLAISDSIIDDLKIISQKLDKKNLVRTTDTLTENIFQLEEVHRSALQVVAFDPLVFSIFINDLKDLDDILQAIVQDVFLMNNGKL